MLESIKKVDKKLIAMLGIMIGVILVIVIVSVFAIVFNSPFLLKIKAQHLKLHHDKRQKILLYILED